MNDLAAWVQESTHGASLRSVAARMDRSPDSLSRWIRKGRMPAEAIIQFARLYRADLLTGVLVGGVIVASDVEAAMPQLLKYATSLHLTAELHRRAEGRTFRTAAS